MGWSDWLSPWRREKKPAAEEESLPATAHKQHDMKWDKNLNATDWSHYTTTQTITFAVLTSLATLGLVHGYKTWLRRIPTVEYLKPGFFHRRSVYGYVSRVGDGDNFHLFHTPGGRLMGWGWLPWRRVDEMKAREFKDKTIHIRIAGIDAPELAHFGRPEQPYGKEAIEWLRSFIFQRYVRVYPYRRDQYDRIVASVYRRRFLFFRSDVGLTMIKNGLATVYEAKMGSEFGDNEQQYRDAEARAKSKGIGMWQDRSLVDKILGRKQAEPETPRQYKTRMAKEEKQNATKDMAK